MSQGRLTGTALGVDATESTLNQLVRVCLDGERGFHAAAEKLNDSNLAHLFEAPKDAKKEAVAPSDPAKPAPAATKSPDIPK